MELDLTLAAVIPVAIGLVELAKGAGLPSRFASLASLVFAIGGSFVFPQETVTLTVFAGLVLGLSASGLYSGTKSVVA